MQWSTVCFDLDNTLYSHELAFEKAMKQTFSSMLEEKKQEEAHSNDVNVSSWFSCFKYYCDSLWPAFENNQLSHQEYRTKRFEKTMDEMGLPYRSDDANLFHTRYEGMVAQYIKPYDTLYDLLKVLHEHKVTIGIITNGNKKTQKEKIERLQLHTYISPGHIFISEEVGVKKPDKEIFDVAIERLHAERKGSLFIGDSWELDVEGPLHAGWDATIYVNTRNESEPDASEQEPVLRCRSLADVYHFLTDV